MDENVYTNDHKLILQVMTSCRLIEYFELEEIFNRLFKDSQTSLQVILRSINRQIAKLKLEIVQLTCEITGKKMVMLYRTVKQDYNSIEKNFTLAEKELISKIFMDIMMSVEGSTSNETIKDLNKRLPEKGFKEVDTDSLIQRLIKEKMLMWTDDNLLCFTVLAITELGPMFKETFGERIIECQLCKHIIFLGVTCQSCQCRVHKHCFKSFVERIKRSRCPECRKPMDVAF